MSMPESMANRKTFRTPASYWLARHPTEKRSHSASERATRTRSPRGVFASILLREADPTAVVRKAGRSPVRLHNQRAQAVFMTSRVFGGSWVGEVGAGWSCTLTQV
jgi:hypothetical protein